MNEQPFDYIFGTVSIDAPKKQNPFQFLSKQVLSMDLAPPYNMTKWMQVTCGDEMSYERRTDMDDAIDGMANYLLLQHGSTKKGDTMEKPSKVTLKVGDVLSTHDFFEPYGEDYYARLIVSLDGSLITRGVKPSDRVYIELSYFDTWFVNGVKYNTEDIIIPITSEIKPESEDITADNLREVLQYNNICQSKYNLTNSGIFFTNGCNRISLDNPNLIKHVMVELGYLKPLPKAPKNLLEWWELNKVDGFYLAAPLWNLNIFELSSQGESLAFIPKVWSIERQISAVQQLTTIYKGDNS